MRKNKAVNLVLGIDVEEEGLFGGQYACQNLSLRNLADLRRLAPLLERGVKPTLFCVAQAFSDPVGRKQLEFLRDRHGAEIACHLHHWTVPPQVADASGQCKSVLHSVPAAHVPEDKLRQKFHHLFSVARDFQGGPVTSFRMGRWDMHKLIWPLLREHGVLADASIRPLHLGASQSSGPDHFDAPREPYRIPVGNGEIFELPLTVAPVLRIFSKIPDHPQIARFLRVTLRHWGCMPLLAVEYPLPLLKMVTAMHVRAGGETLSLTWHSSEMMPAGAPHMPDAGAVRKFMDKMRAYVDWLQSVYHVNFETLSSLRQKIASSVPVALSTRADWNL